MESNGYPKGNCALHPHWPQARFNLSGIFSQQPLLIHLITLTAEIFDCRLPIEAAHDGLAARWNAGRVSHTQFNPAAIEKTLDFLNSRQIGFFATFTNHLLGESDLRDPPSNGLLELLAHRSPLNGVIISSDLLSAYIARRFPDLKQIASIIKVTSENGRGRPDYYNDLGRRFHRYVVHPDDCRDLKLLDHLDRSKAEIIVNENCVADCPNRQHHYDAYARWHTATTDAQRQAAGTELRQIIQACGSPMDLKTLQTHRRNCNLTPSEMRAVYDLGFRHFKLQGRADNPLFYALDLTRTLLEPDLVAPLVLKTLLRFTVQNTDLVRK